MKLLFLCTHNACRSILAEAISRQLAGPRITVASAGSHPAGRVHPLTLQHLQRCGYPTAGLVSKSLQDLADFQADAVITVCDQAAGEACPLWLNDTVKVHWGLPDPTAIEGSEQAVTQAFSELIELLQRRIRWLLEQSGEAPEPSELEQLLLTAGGIH